MPSTGVPVMPLVLLFSIVAGGATSVWVGLSDRQYTARSGWAALVAALLVACVSTTVVLSDMRVPAGIDSTLVGTTAISDSGRDTGRVFLVLADGARLEAPTDTALPIRLGTGCRRPPWSRTFSCGAVAFEDSWLLSAGMVFTMTTFFAALPAERSSPVGTRSGPPEGNHERRDQCRRDRD